MADRPTAIIVGANFAGHTAAETLRKEGFEGRVVLIGDEPERPYERPPLSKDYLLGLIEPEEFFLGTSKSYVQRDIDLLLDTRVIRLDPAARQVELSDGQTRRYDHLLIATGASPRRLRIPGSDLADIHYLRTLQDATALRDRLEAARKAGERVVIIGMGFIGAEVASSARNRGLEVVALEATDALMVNSLGREAGEIIEQVHRDHGVQLHTGTQVAEFRGRGKVEQVVTASGETFDCGFVVVGIGVSPNVAWLEGSGLAINNGVVVDEFCRTNLPDVYAAGDVASWWHPGIGERVRVEHYDHAGEQSVAAVKTMLGKGAPYVPVPYFWSEQYDLNIQLAGFPAGYDQLVWRGSVASNSWSAFYLTQGQFRAVLSVNRFKDLSPARRLLAQHIPVSDAQLANESVDLKALLNP